MIEDKKYIIEHNDNIQINMIYKFNKFIIIKAVFYKLLFIYLKITYFLIHLIIFI